MTCYVYQCENNEQGECSCQNYITIQKDGTCDSMLVKETNNEKDI